MMEKIKDVLATVVDVLEGLWLVFLAVSCVVGVYTIATWVWGVIL